MIDAQLLADEGILVVAPVDKLQATDFERLRLLADPYLEQNGELNGLLIDAEAFFGWEDFASLLSHIRFVRSYQEKIERVAAVTDSSLIAFLPKAAQHFVAAEVRHFRYQQRDAALQWLRTGQPP